MNQVLRGLILPATILILTAPACAAPAPRNLLVEVREGAPAEHPSFLRGADNSYTVSTGGEGDRDERPRAPTNGVVLATGTAPQRLRLREGERLRVDLPGLQSLQFHLPAGGRAAGTLGTAGGSPAAPGVSGVVSFPAVAAFAARFFLAGERVRIELTPLGTGGVQAPWAGLAPPAGPLLLEGAPGEWIALGDAQGPPPRSLQPSADAGPAQVWVRVYPADAPPAPTPR